MKPRSAHLPIAVTMIAVTMIAVTMIALATVSARVWAQDSSPAKLARAAIEGVVTKDPDSQPVKKALIELIAENQSQGGDYTATTGADGGFRIENILPGRYHLFAERTGLLDSDKHRAHPDGRILTLTAGQEVKDIHIRLQAAAIVRGRVTDEDGDPMANAEVSVLRQSFASGRSHWEQVAAERTNDLGEYRIANLAAGNVYVSVSPPPDFKSLIEASGAAARAAFGAAPNETHDTEKTGTSYQTTYYPGTSDRSQASPIHLHAGDDFPVNFSLTPGPALSIHGSVVNLPPRTSASIMLQSRDFSIVLNGAEMHKDGSFVIRDVSPGSYNILATVEGSTVPMMARQSLQVVSSNIDGLRLAPQPGALLRGRLRLESRGTGRIDGETFLALQSADGDGDDGVVNPGDRFSNLAHVGADGSFEWKDVPPGNYYVQIMRENDANGDWFLKSLSAGGRDMNDSGIAVNGGTIMLDLVASADGGVISGVVIDAKGEPVANAVVVAAPEARMRRRVDRYRKTVSDQSGHFSLRGIRPGDYTVFSWESVEGEAFYSPEFLKAYEAQGVAVPIAEGSQKALQLTAIPSADDQP
jgi:protocatechuate 3,4-dioxygenase beta subunit